MPRVPKNHPEYQYLNLLEEIYKHGIKNVDRGTGDTSYSLFGRQARFDLSKGFPLLTTKKVFWRGIVEELYWFILGQNNIKYLVDKDVHIWDDYPYKIYKEKVEAKKEPDMTKDEFIAKIAQNASFAKKHGVLQKIYGELWRHWPTRKNNKTIDQLKWLINEIKVDPYARNAIVSSWNPEYLYTMAEQEDAARFPLCHIFYQVSVKNGKLNLHLYQRTCDMFLGVPFNIACYSLLTMILAKITGYKPGEFIHSYGDVHIYANHMDQVKEQLKRSPRTLPAVTIKSLKSIDEFRPEHVIIKNYNPHPALKGELSVSGGFFTKYAKKTKAKN